MISVFLARWHWQSNGLFRGHPDHTAANQFTSTSLIERSTVRPTGKIARTLNGAALDPSVSTLPDTRQSSALSTQQLETCNADQCEIMLRRSPFGRERSVVAHPIFLLVDNRRAPPPLPIGNCHTQSRCIAYLQHASPTHPSIPPRSRFETRSSCISRPRTALDYKRAIRARQHRVGLDSCCGTVILTIARW